MTYEYPNNPYSWGNTNRMSKMIKEEKEDQKREELKQELDHERNN